MSTLKVNTIQDTTGNDALTIDSSGNVTASQGFVPSTQLSHRNLIINGAMQVAQRGTSFTVGGLGVYTIDRFNLDESTDGSLTVSQSTEAPDNFKYSMKITPASADTSIASSQYARLKYFMEGNDVNHLGFGTSSAKDLTLSFYAKTNKTGTYCFSLDLLGGTERTYINEVSLTNTWTRYTLSIPKNTAQAFGNSTNGKSSELQLVLAAGTDYNGTADDWTNTSFSTSNQVNFMDSTSNELYITGVQLEVGSVATPFEHRSYGEELARCQRYYATSDGGYNLAVDIQDASFPSTNFPVTMRVSPTATVYTANNGTINKMSRYAGISCTVSSVSTYPNGIRLIQHDSESNGQSWAYRWTADAEL